MAFVIGLAGFTIAQNSLSLQSATLTSEAVETLSNEFIRQGDIHTYAHADRYYLILQFDSPPSAEMKSILSLQGIDLLDYLPHNAFIASIASWVPVEAIRAEALIPILPSFKIAPSLANTLSGDAKSTIEVRALAMKNIKNEILFNVLKKEGYSSSFKEEVLTVEVMESELLELAGHPAIRWLELPAPTPEPEGIAANAQMRNNVLTQGPTNGFDGTGVVIGIADDGNVVHPDVYSRILFPLDYLGGTHGDMTAGIAAGAGNIDPRAMGLSPGAHIHLTSISGYFHIINAVDRYQQYNVTITSSSYGQNCGGYYSADSELLDDQLSNHAPLMHVFSVGNKGNSDCSAVYGHLQGPGNIRYGAVTGGYKASKNGIACGNATFGDILVASSSRGPVEDGRIKPDICAIGQGSLTTGEGSSYRLGSGTSAAAPAIAGILANLTHAYKFQYYGQQPSSALLKACLLNGARDIGRPGPDYETGWGLAHAGNALEMIQMQHYVSASVVHAGQRNHSVQVPGGVKSLKVMLYWHDEEGSPLAGQALVNDLDLRVINPTGGVNLPLVLDSSPSIASLTSPAAPGFDRINNVEQVVINNPQAGNYTFQVMGHQVPIGPQEYYVVYHWETEALEVSYPNGNETLVPGEQEYIVWDAVGNSNSFTVQFSSNGGISYQTIASNVSGHLRQINWIVPNQVSGQCLIRILRNGQSATSLGHFNILGTPTFHITSAGNQSALISWEAVAGANSYDVYKLIGDYMQIIGSTPNNDYSVDVQPGEGAWYSVRARHTNGIVGRRAIAQFYEHYDCGSQITLRLILDAAPYQTSWSIANASGVVMASGGPYTSSLAYQTLEIPVCLPQSCYSFTINDSGNNGLCCQYGQGGYQIIASNGIVLASGASFGSSASNNFCLQQSGPPLQMTIHNSSQTTCFGDNDGWAVVMPSGGTGNYSYLWSNGANTQQISNLAGGLYTVTVSDGSSTLISQAIITEPTPLSIDIYTENNPCGEVADGEATATVAGGTPPYTYTWSNGSNLPFISLVEPGYYQLTVTDANGCIDVAGTNIFSSSSLEIYTNYNSPSCHNASNGIAYIYVVGGQGALTYNWSNGGTGTYINNIPGGLYSVTVTDEIGCSSEATILVTTPNPISVSTTIGQDGASINLQVSGGVSPYNYLWNDGAQTANREGLTSGVYTVTISDANGCTQVTSTTINAQNTVICTSTAQESAYNWIEEVSIGGMMAQTGNNQGYADFTDELDWQAVLSAGQVYPITLTPGFQFSSFHLHWRVYADLNEDGDFSDAGELLFSPPASAGIIEGQIILPNVAAGTKRLRISMAFGTPPSACANILYGEVEDYLIILSDDTEYCTSGGQSTSQEWIQSVQFGGEQVPTGNNNGYGDFSGTLFQVEQGQTLSFSLVPGYEATPYPENWSIWIDFNNDGIFSSDNELVYYAFNQIGVVNGIFTIPSNVPSGQVRMRVVMRWDQSVGACDEYTWGETEDYSLLIGSGSPLGGNEVVENRSHFESVNDIADVVLKLWPNPASDRINLQYQLSQNSDVDIILLHTNGSLIERHRMAQVEGSHYWTTDVSDLPAGGYMIIVKAAAESWVQPFIIH
jgi:hypothetical protein